jgi:hypothetical protein
MKAFLETDSELHQHSKMIEQLPHSLVSMGGAAADWSFCAKRDASICSATQSLRCTHIQDFVINFAVLHCLVVLLNLHRNALSCILSASAMLVSKKVFFYTCSRACDWEDVGRD